MKKKLIVFCAFISTFISMQAQEYIDRDFKMDYNFDVLGFPGAAPSPIAGTAHVEVIDFGVKGKTIIIKFDCPALEEEFKKNNQDPELVTSYSWSGKDIHLVKSEDNGDLRDCYIVLRGNLNNGVPCASLLESAKEKMRLFMIMDGAKSGGISDLRKGMGRAELEKKLGEIRGNFEQTGNAGNLRIWTKKIPQMQQSKITGNYSINNNRKYGDFYFDANDKLVKWFLYQ